MSRGRKILVGLLIASLCLAVVCIAVVHQLWAEDAARLEPGTYAVSGAELTLDGDKLVLPLLRGGKTVVVGIYDVKTEGANFDGTYLRVDSEVEGNHRNYYPRSVVILLSAQKAEWDATLASARAIIERRNSPRDLPPPKIVGRFPLRLEPSPTK